MRDYRVQNKPGWSKARVVKALGPRNILCNVLDDLKLVWKRHANQIRKIGHFYADIYDDLSSKEKKILEEQSSDDENYAEKNYKIPEIP